MEGNNRNDIFLRSADPADRETSFFRKVEELETENIRLIVLLPGKGPGKTHGRLNDRSTYYRGKTMLGLVWACGHELPEAIKEQVLLAFLEIFGGT